MKKLVFAAAILALTIAGCKKDKAGKFKTDMTGRWEISKIEPVSVLNPVIPGDYYDFKDGDDDIVEVRRNGNLQSGTYSPTIGNELNMTIGGTLYKCKVDVLESNRFEFTAVGGGVTEKVYLRK